MSLTSLDLVLLFLKDWCEFVAILNPSHESKAALFLYILYLFLDISVECYMAAQINQM